MRWQIITDKTNSEETFGKSADKSSVVSLHVRTYSIGKNNFSTPKIFYHSYDKLQINKLILQVEFIFYRSNDIGI